MSLTLLLDTIIANGATLAIATMLASLVIVSFVVASINSDDNGNDSYNGNHSRKTGSYNISPVS